MLYIFITGMFGICAGGAYASVPGTKAYAKKTIIYWLSFAGMVIACIGYMDSVSGVDRTYGAVLLCAVFVLGFFISGGKKLLNSMRKKK